MSWRRSFTSFVTTFHTLQLQRKMKHSGHQNKQLVSTKCLWIAYKHTPFFPFFLCMYMKCLSSYPIIIICFICIFFQFIITLGKKGTSVMIWSCSKSNFFLTVILFSSKIVKIDPECFFFLVSIQHFLFYTSQLAIKKALRCSITVI